MNVLTKAVAGIALSLAFAVPAMAGVCTSQTTLAGMGPPGSATFGQTFITSSSTNATRGDCYTFNLSAPANATGTTAMFDFSAFADISLTNVSLFGGGVLAGATQGLALYSDNTPSTFAFTTSAPGAYTLQVTSVTSGCIFSVSCLPVGYNGTITTTTAAVAVPEPASLALLGLGLLGLGFTRRKVTS